MPDHNHVSRDIKSPGTCPACDALLRGVRSSSVGLSPKLPRSQSPEPSSEG